MSSLTKGELIEGTIASLKPFGAFVDFGGASGLLHIKQISKSYISALGDVFKVGDPVKAIVLNIDEQKGRIALSTQVLEKYPGEILKELPTMMVCGVFDCSPFVHHDGNRTLRTMSHVLLPR